MTEFLLVHGAWHGAWCWDELIPALAERGHTARALDLPGLGQDQTPLAEVSLDAYVSRVIEHARSIGRPLWLVGHSMGGIPITQAAETLSDQVLGLVYVTAFLPKHGQSLIELLMADTESKLNSVMTQDQANGTASVPEEHVRECFYHQCSERQVKTALSRLRRQQAGLPAITPVALASASAAGIPKFYIECLQDNAISIGAQRRMHQQAGVTRVATLDSDHSPFFSRPTELAGILDEFARVSVN